MSGITVQGLVEAARAAIDTAIERLASAEELSRVLQGNFTSDSILDGARDSSIQDARDEMESVVIELASIAQGMAESVDLKEVPLFERWVDEKSGARSAGSSL
jgi:hypothetical protein